MADEDRPQIYLITPPTVDLQTFPDRLAAVLDRNDVACLRLALAGTDEYDLGRVADALRVVAHERDVAVVIDTHVALAARHGLDGVHLLDSARSVRAARERTSTTPPWVRPKRAPKVPGMTSSPSSIGVGMNEARPPKW